MKNIQVIDAATNCTFSLFQATDEEFALLFPEPRQDIQYAEDLGGLPRQERLPLPYNKFGSVQSGSRTYKVSMGRCFNQLQRYKTTYREKREDAAERNAINAAQRRLFGIS